MLSQILVWLQFKPHYEAEENSVNILATFSSGLAIKDTVSNLVSEIFGTFAVGTLIVGIGFSLGGTTGYALNPAHDLRPRIMHRILPIPNEGDGDWSYA